MTYQDFPKWIDAPQGHPGHPHNPGKVLVENEDQEREVTAGGEPPRELNPEASEKTAPSDKDAPPPINARAKTAKKDD